MQHSDATLKELLDYPFQRGDILYVTGHHRVVPTDVFHTYIPDDFKGLVARNESDKGCYRIDVDAEGMVHCQGSQYEGVSGMGFQDNSRFLGDYVSEYVTYPSLRYLPEGTVLPAGIELVHRHDDQFRLQPSVTTTLADFNAVLVPFVLSLRKLDKREFFETEHHNARCWQWCVEKDCPKCAKVAIFPRPRREYRIA